MFKLFYMLKDHLKKYWKYYFFGIFFLVLSTCITLITPQVISYFINQITNSTFNQETLIIIIILMLVMLLVSYGLGFLWIYLIYIGGQKYNYDTRRNIHKKIIQVDNDFLLKFKVGDVITRLTSDLNNVTLAASDGVYFTVEALSSLILIIIAMYFTTNLTLTLIVIIPLAILSICANYLSVKASQRYDLSQQATSTFSSAILQVIKGIKIVKGFNQQQRFTSELDVLNDDVFDKSSSFDRIDVIIGPLYRIFYGLVYTMAITYGIYLVMKNEISIGQLVAFNLYIGILEWPIYALELVFGTLQRGVASITRVQELVDYQEQQSYNGIAKVDSIEKIEFSDFSYGYTDKLVLNDISFSITKNKKIGIVGKIGSGKSTLVKQLLFLYKARYSGSLTINQIDFIDIDKDTYLQNIAYVSQESEIFALSIRDNILIGKSDASDEEIYTALEHACFKDEVLNFKNGLDTLVEEAGISLSGGQQQRLSLARALIKESNVLILDDVLAAVDLKTEAKIISNLNTYYSNRTIVIISHRLSCIVSCDNIIVLDEGRIVEEGNHLELIKENGWYAKQYQLQEMGCGYND